jgi:predicted nucleic acid-binding protein
MRVVVADTGPLNYLVLIGEIEVLPRLFGRVFVPVAVSNELMRRGAPTAVKDWATRPPAWLAVEPDPPIVIVNQADSALDEGEQAAIALAKMLNADLLLIDERSGAAAARREGLTVTGTLGVLDLAASRGLVDLAASFNRLKATNFRYRSDLLDAILARRQGHDTK